MKKLKFKTLMFTSVAITPALAAIAMSCSQNQEKKMSPEKETIPVNEEYVYNQEVASNFLSAVSGNIGTRFQVANIIRGALGLDQNNEYSEEYGILQFLKTMSQASQEKRAKFEEFNNQVKTKIGELVNFAGDKTALLQQNKASKEDYLSARANFNQKANEFLALINNFGKVLELEDFANIENKDIRYYVDVASKDKSTLTGVVNLDSKYLAKVAPENQNSVNDLTRFYESIANLIGQFFFKANNSVLIDNPNHVLYKFAQFFALIANRMDLLLASRAHVASLVEEKNKENAEGIKQELQKHTQDIKTRYNKFKQAIDQIANTKTNLEFIASYDSGKNKHNLFLEAKAESENDQEKQSVINSIQTLLDILNGNFAPLAQNNNAKAGLLDAMDKLNHFAAIEASGLDSTEGFMNYFSQVSSSWMAGVGLFVNADEFSKALKDFNSKTADIDWSQKGKTGVLVIELQALLEKQKEAFSSFFAKPAEANLGSAYIANHAVRNLTSYLQYVASKISEQYKAQNELEVYNPLIK
ncbi:hypothetical protein [Mycoplasma sp. Ms02]|uniref:hypothetical protein n=1 Tax=Mycoplasma sp. Ms02 TaxID=353851 RepID=UPI001C89B91E|nr:hypothetical protein [Mycoplasma sp. Ms02]QZE12412.1 hypothetical protein K4L35_00250 [Mycoplasma sp. Ms02]